MEELWKSVVGCNGYYEVSNLGRVKSLPRSVRRGVGTAKNIRERILKYGVVRGGYYCVNICNGTTVKKFQVHVLVAIAFLNHVPNGHERIVDHINGNKTDNRLENLRIVTHRFNLAEGYRKTRDRESSTYPGVCWHKMGKKWMSSITIDGLPKYLGCFNAEIDAANAYKNKLSTIENK